eukprot:1719960-Rhodomonas_salina.1
MSPTGDICARSRSARVSWQCVRASAADLVVFEHRHARALGPNRRRRVLGDLVAPGPFRLEVQHHLERVRVLGVRLVVRAVHFVAPELQLVLVVKRRVDRDLHQALRHHVAVPHPLAPRTDLARQPEHRVDVDLVVEVEEADRDVVPDQHFADLPRPRALSAAPDNHTAHRHQPTGVGQRRHNT